MRFSAGNLTSKSQVTVPAWVRETLGVTPKTEIVWLEFKPGEITVIAKQPVKGNPFHKLYGILKGKNPENIDLVAELLEDRRKDNKLAERGFTD